jgi:hypothetical protein
MDAVVLTSTSASRAPHISSSTSRSSSSTLLKSATPLKTLSTPASCLNALLYDSESQSLSEVLPFRLHRFHMDRVRTMCRVSRWHTRHWHISSTASTSSPSAVTSPTANSAGSVTLLGCPLSASPVNFLPAGSPPPAPLVVL